MMAMQSVECCSIPELMPFYAWRSGRSAPAGQIHRCCSPRAVRPLVDGASRVVLGLVRLLKRRLPIVLELPVADACDLVGELLPGVAVEAPKTVVDERLYAGGVDALDE